MSKEQKVDSGLSGQNIGKPRVGRRLSSYAKLKLENEKLKHEIYLLLKEPDTMEANLVKIRYLLSYSVVDAAMFGDVTNVENKFSGLLEAVSNGG